MVQLIQNVHTPLCRQLRKDLISTQENQRKRAQLVKEDPKATKFAHLSETEFDDSLKPSPLNKVQGGRDCLVCEEILLGEGINPRNPDVMDAKIKSYSDIVENKLLKQKPHDDVLKKHLKNVHLCGKAFSDHRCTIVGKVKTVEPIAPLAESHERGGFGVNRVVVLKYIFVYDFFIGIPIYSYL